MGGSPSAGSGPGHGRAIVMAQKTGTPTTVPAAPAPPATTSTTTTSAPPASTTTTTMTPAGHAADPGDDHNDHDSRAVRHPDPRPDRRPTARIDDHHDRPVPNRPARWAAHSHLVVTTTTTTTAPAPPVIATDCSTDVSAVLNAYLAALPDGSVFTSPASACYLVDEGINVCHPLTIVGGRFEDDSDTVPAWIPGREAPSLHPIILIKETSDVTIDGVDLVGANPTGKYHPALVGQSGVDIRSSSDVTVRDVTTLDTFGDGMTVFVASGKGKDRNITVDGLTITRAGRQGSPRPSCPAPRSPTSTSCRPPTAPGTSRATSPRWAPATSRSATRPGGVGST